MKQGVLFDKIEHGQSNSTKQHPHQRMLTAPISPVEREVALSRHPPGWTVQSSSHQVNFRVACWAPSPSHVQGRNPAGGLKQAEIFMPHPENQTSETELMPLERNQGGISGD